MEIYTTFQMQGYKDINSEGGLSDVVDLEIVAENEKEALSKAESLIPDKKWNIKMISNSIKTGENLSRLFVYQAYESETADGRLQKNVIVQVLADTIENALKSVKEKITKKEHRLWKVIEQYT